ncbi:nuclear transport factor 2 family protein [Micromonospora sp. NPDC048999]|uniref:nuclear transport factor 2 family protein n=1 Tax=Micromonospora sp. NPDC048999 TaxID=3155391 RepID=UPI0033CDACC1
MINNEPPSRVVAADRAAIAGIVRTFFGAFTSGANSSARLDALRQVFLPEAVIIGTCGGEPAVYGVESFIAPRKALLSNGTLVGFHEWELSGHTEVFGDIAQHFCSYAKEGVRDGKPFTARGMKTLQLVRTSAGWRISAVAWDDERDNLVIELEGHPTQGTRPLA